MKFNKLVTHIATDSEYVEKLKEKLQDEVEEFLLKPSGEELAFLF